jgi:hypothetical protein
MPWLKRYKPIINWDRRSTELKSKGDNERPVDEKEPFDLRSDELQKKDAVVLATHIRPRKLGNGKSWERRIRSLESK